MQHISVVTENVYYIFMYVTVRFDALRTVFCISTPEIFYFRYKFFKCFHFSYFLVCYFLVMILLTFEQREIGKKNIFSRVVSVERPLTWGNKLRYQMYLQPPFLHPLNGWPFISRKCSHWDVKIILLATLAVFPFNSSLENKMDWPSVRKNLARFARATITIKYSSAIQLWSLSSFLEKHYVIIRLGWYSGLNRYGPDIMPTRETIKVCVVFKNSLTSINYY